MIAFAVAVAIVVLLMRPSEKGPARTCFSIGNPTPSTGGNEEIEITSDSYGRLCVTHRNAVPDSGAYEMSCSFVIAGNDIRITEKRICKPIAVVGSPTAEDIRYFCEEPLNGRFHVYFDASWCGRLDRRICQSPRCRPENNAAPPVIRLPSSKRKREIRGNIGKLGENFP